MLAAIQAIAAARREQAQERAEGAGSPNLDGAQRVDLFAPIRVASAPVPSEEAGAALRATVVNEERQVPLVLAAVPTKRQKKRAT